MLYCIYRYVDLIDDVIYFYLVHGDNLRSWIVLHKSFYFMTRLDNNPFSNPSSVHV